ncbi:MAG: helix-turn-helix domain-containing protein [Firmicutes bacterium]|nr:helix-turn-helix domain-containing protein [Bacillota bacterium]
MKNLKGSEVIPENCLRQVRQQAGLSQAELADRAGVARQTVGGIESRQYGPSLAVAFRLAAALGKKIEDIFQMPDIIPDEVPAVWSGMGQLPEVGEKIQLARLPDGKYTAFPANRDSLQVEANAAVVGMGSSKERLLARVLEPEGLTAPAVILAGCSPALAMLKQRLDNRYRDVNICWINTNSMASLQALANGLIHGAGVHIYDEETGEYNLPVVNKVLHQTPYMVVNLCYGEQGFVVNRGNPRGIAGFGDLSRQDVRIVNRELGAETRRLLDSGLKQNGLLPSQVAGYNFQVQTHQEVAQAVALSGADCGITLRPLARLYKLDFIPLSRERYDLVFLLEDLKHAGVQAILECLQKPRFLLDLEASGYDPESTGKVLSEVKF